MSHDDPKTMILNSPALQPRWTNFEGSERDASTFWQDTATLFFISISDTGAFQDLTLADD